MPDIEPMSDGELAALKDNLRSAYSPLFDEACRLVARLDAAEKRAEEAEADLADLLVDLFCEIAVKREDGWYDSMARSTSCWAGDKLVEMGLWEQHPTDGTGRRQFYRPKQAAEAAKEAGDDADE